MTRVARAVLLALLVACGGGAEQGSQPPVSEETGVDSTVVIPEYPRPERGRLAAVSMGQYDLNGVWKAEAGRCDSLGLLQVLASEATNGAILLLRLPPDSVEGPYPIVVPTKGLGPAPSAQVAAQQHGDRGSRAFQADSGVVDVTAFGERVSGRAKVVLREISNRDRIGYAVSFQAVPVAVLDSAQCALAAEGTATVP